MIALLGSYLFWHYTVAFKDLSTHFKNFLWFFYHFFSIPVLARTFFEPWKRMQEQYPKGFDIAGRLSTLLINSLMRAIGVLMRGVLLVVGCLLLVVVFLVGLAFFVIWAVIPWLAILLLISGARLLFI